MEGRKEAREGTDGATADAPASLKGIRRHLRPGTVGSLRSSVSSRAARGTGGVDPRDGPGRSAP